MSANRMAGTMPGAVGAAVDMLRWPSTAAMANPRDHTTETVAQIPAPWFASREQQQQGQQQQQVIAQQQQVIALQQQQQQQQLQLQQQLLQPAGNSSQQRLWVMGADLCLPFLMLGCTGEPRNRCYRSEAGSRARGKDRSAPRVRRGQSHPPGTYEAPARQIFEM